MDTKDDFGLENSISNMAILYMLNIVKFQWANCLFPIKYGSFPKGWPLAKYHRCYFSWNLRLGVDGLSENSLN